MTKIAPPSSFGEMTDATTLRIERVLAGPIERVWAYLTESDLRRQWLAAGDMQNRAGTEVELVWHNDDLTSPPGQRPEGFGAEHRFNSTVTVYEPPHRLGLTFFGGSEVLFELAPRGGTVVLTLTHHRLPNRGMSVNVGAGWHAHLDVLEAKLSDVTFTHFWDHWSKLREAYEQRVPAEQAAE